MQKWLAIIVGTILVLGLGGIAYNFFTKSSVPADPTTAVTLPIVGSTAKSPTSFALDFYSWYITSRTHSPDFPSDHYAAVLAPWLSENFIFRWRDIVTSTEADPILWAQDSPSTWGTGLTATSLSESESDSLVRVAVGAGSSLHTFTVHLVKNLGSWKVDSVQGTL